MVGARRYAQYGFPEAILEPGEERRFKVKPKGLFRGQKIVMVGQMDEIRGVFRIRYSRLPLLNRENVIAYSSVTRVKSRRRTTVEYREGATGNFVRSYLPSSVQYRHVDPLSYIDLLQIFCGRENQMPNVGGGVCASYFGTASFGNMLSVRSTDLTIVVVLRNHGDIKVRVAGAILGLEI